MRHVGAVQHRRRYPGAGIHLLHQHGRGVGWLVSGIGSRASIAVRNDWVIDRAGLEPGVSASNSLAECIQLKSRTRDELPVTVERSICHLVNLLSLLMQLLASQIYCTMSGVRRG